MDDFEIELLDKNESNDSVALPINFITLGEIATDDVKVYIKKNVYEELESYAKSDTSKELGTILVGNYTDALGKQSVIISDYILAKYTDASASTLTFTHETWNYVYSEKDKHYKDKRIVGWQHTHPSYGIFLSNYDLFIQENFFNLPFQIAYVIDPIQNKRGFFQWKNGKIEKLKGFYLYDEGSKPIKIHQLDTEPNDINDPGIKKTKNKALPIILAILLVINVVAMGMLFSNVNRLTKENITLNSKVSEQNSKLSELQFEQFTDIGEPISEDYNNTKDTDLSLVQFKKYKVKSGETLISICNDNSIDYNEYRNIILSVNGINNENEIYVDEIILIPVMDDKQ